MTVTRTLDLAIESCMPQPIAAAWQRLSQARNDSEYTAQLLAAFELTLQTLAALAVPDVLRRQTSTGFGKALEDLSPPTLGRWVGLIPACAVELDGQTDAFLTPLPTWCLDSEGKPSPHARLIDEADRHTDRPRATRYRAARGVGVQAR